MILAAQCGTIPIMHIGGGETTGETYVMHIPRKLFFSEVQQVVDKRGLTDVQDVLKVSQDVFNRNLEGLVGDEILGLKINKSVLGEKIAVISPIVTESEYEKHMTYFDSNGIQEFLLVHLNYSLM